MDNLKLSENILNVPVDELSIEERPHTAFKLLQVHLGAGSITFEHLTVYNLHHSCLFIVTA